MNTFITSFLIIFIAIVSIGGCGEDIKVKWRPWTFDHIECFSTKDDCEELKILNDCKSAKFKPEGSPHCPEGNECRLKGCKFSSSSSILFAEEEASLTIFNMKQSCDVIAMGEFSTDSENECEDLAIDRDCESFEFIPSEEDNFLNECWLYDCQQCLLESPIIDEEFVE